MKPVEEDLHTIFSIEGFLDRVPGRNLWHGFVGDLS